MSQPRYRHLQTAVDQGVLVLTPTPARLEGDAIAQSLVEDTQAAVAHAGADKVVVNMEHVEFLTSANFRPLIALRKQLLAAGGRLVLCNLCGPILEVFQTTRLISSAGASSVFFEVQPDVPAAVASLLRNPGTAGAPKS
jgi:anti-anti-sigma factor